MRLARVLGAVGRTLITAGVLILLFVVYQLWGTAIRHNQAQDRLENEFEAALAEVTTTTRPGVTVPRVTTTTVPPPPPAGGDAAAHLVIPKIGVDEIVVEGVTLSDLKKGPGHYPETPMPGQKGNAAIAGHRTTYGAPFNRIDELVGGDEILVTTLQGSFRYEVIRQRIVEPTEVSVLDDKKDNRLTLTACHPKYSARQRIVVIAKLAAKPVPAPVRVRPIPEDPAVQPPLSFEADLDGESADNAPAIAAGAICAAIWMMAWLIGRWWRKWPSYFIAAPFFFVMLFIFFENFARLLPSNF
jgi:sortase A